MPTTAPTATTPVAPSASSWRRRGLIVAHGPVMDPSGGYGLALYQISDDQDIATITSEDPIVKNGAGHYEHYPMLHLKSRATVPPS